MPVVGQSTVPEKLKTFTFHGLELTPNGGQAHGECPFCDKPKFYVALDTGKFDCKSCQRSGNPLTFLRQLYEAAEMQPVTNLTPLATERKIPALALAKWGVVKNPVNGEWLIPGYDHKGEVCQLYAYRFSPVTRKHEMRATPGMDQGQRHGLHGVPLYDPNKPEVYQAEGFWDGCSLWYALATTKRTESGFEPTKDINESLLSQANVLAAPSANVFNEKWKPYYADKDVWLCYDNDHPKTNPQTGQEVGLAGLNGMKRAFNVLRRRPGQAKAIFYLNWGGENGVSTDLKDGYDVRDLLTEDRGPGGRSRGVANLLGRLEPVPEVWGISDVSTGGGNDNSLSPLECTSWQEVRNAMKLAWHWTEGMEAALPCMYAVSTATMAPGFPLWMRVLGPPSTGKSTLAEAIATDKKHVKALDTLTSLYSGYQKDKAGSENVSLLQDINGKMLIIKDADTIMKHPNRAQLMAQLRALSDRNIRTRFGNDMSKDWLNQNTSVIFCGTGGMKGMDASELGDRFLDVPMSQHIGMDEEYEILSRVAHGADTAMNYECNGTAADNYTPEKVKAMRLAGGYAAYLRENARDLFEKTPMPDGCKHLAINYGRFVSFMRSRPSKEQDEVHEKEFAARLVEQMVRLSKSLAVVLQHPSVDMEIMKRVRTVALETAKGRSLVITGHLYKWSTKGLTFDTLLMLTGEDKKKLSDLLYFMRKIKCVETYRDLNPQFGGRKSGETKWRLTAQVMNLYKTVVVGEED